MPKKITKIKTEKSKKTSVVKPKKKTVIKKQPIKVVKKIAKKIVEKGKTKTKTTKKKGRPKKSVAPKKKIQKKKVSLKSGKSSNFSKEELMETEKLFFLSEDTFLEEAIAVEKSKEANLYSDTTVNDVKVSFIETPSEHLKIKAKTGWRNILAFRKKSKCEGTIEELIEDSLEDERNVVKFGNKFFFNSWKIAYNTATGFFALCIGIFLAIFALNFASLIFSEKDQLLRSSIVAVNNLMSGAKKITSQDTKEAFAYFADAENKFLEAKSSLNKIDLFAFSIASFSKENSQKLDFGKQMVDLGIEASVVASGFTQAMDYILVEDNTAITDRIEKALVVFDSILPHMKELGVISSKVSVEDVPEEFKERWGKISELVPRLNKDLSRFSEVSGSLLNILGHTQKKRYLLIFQNNTELRATGGFMGSFAIMDIYKGKIVNLEIPGGGPYDLRAGLSVNVSAPEPLHLVNSQWEFQDSNWFADWPTSAEKVKWFYGKSGGSSVDGVIALNIFLFRDILSLVGPVEMPEYKMTLTSDNFLESIQSYVEFEYDKEENKPKKIIADLAPELLDKLFSMEAKRYLDVADILGNSIVEKNLLIYFSDSELEKKIYDLGWAAELKMANKDYLMVVNTNIAGGKTDGVVKESINLVTHVKDNGEVYNELTIKRTHNGDVNNLFTGLKNINYLRVYVPQGSKLMEAKGFDKIPDIYFLEETPDAVKDETVLKVEKNERIDSASGVRITDEFGKTVFADWVQTDVGETSEIKLIYKLPFQMDFENSVPSEDLIEKVKNWIYGGDTGIKYYSILTQKQPGSWGSSFEHVIYIPQHWNVKWFYPKDTAFDNNVLSFKKILENDSLLSFIVDKP